MAINWSSPTLVLRDVEIPGGRWRNFSGEEREFNPEGNRNFTVFLPEDVAVAMEEDGWNVKRRKPRDDSEDPDGPMQPFIKVIAGYKYAPPIVEVITPKGKFQIGQHELEILDWADIEKADMIIKPSRWGGKTPGARSGISAYLRELYVTIRVSELAEEYSEVPVIAPSVQPLAIEAGSQNPDEDIIEGEIVEEDEE